MNFRKFSLSEKLQKPFLYLVIICTVIVIGREIYQDYTRTEKINRAVSIERDNGIGDNVYSVNNLEDRSIYGNTFMKATKNHYEELKLGKHTLENPLFVYNLFGTNKLGMNVFFRTKAEYSVDFTITVDEPAIPAFSGTLKNDGTNNLKKIQTRTVLS